MIGISPGLWTLSVHVTVDKADTGPTGIVRWTELMCGVCGSCQHCPPLVIGKMTLRKMLPMRNNTQHLIYIFVCF